ncbi:Uncharacterized protein OBRU01_01430 [Operophtera brumata]|uniref:Uncharacterized protein n=1 Tax=Operophtera brumata TaxID=104452 RepID=A0A0L7LU14_OPEBR|nr:Uncharacterized protein OBRU01_01430 [Operophtera brumata]
MGIFRAKLESCSVCAEGDKRVDYEVAGSAGTCQENKDETEPAQPRQAITAHANDTRRRPAYGKVTIITTIHKRLNERKTPAQTARARAPTLDICVATQMRGMLAYQLQPYLGQEIGNLYRLSIGGTQREAGASRRAPPPSRGDTATRQVEVELSATPPPPATPPHTR